MSGAPTITVKLDNGTGTYPTDISSRVLMSEGLTISEYGRGDEFSQAQAATLSLVLDNADGTLTTGGTITPGQGIQVSMTSGATTKTRFTGRITELDLGWPSGGSGNANLGVTAVDFLADLSRRTLRAMLEEEVLLDAPTAYYPMGEDAGSTSAGDVSGNGQSPLSAAGTGTAPAFGTEGGPGELPVVTFNGGEFLQSTWAPSGNFAVVGFFSRASAPANPEVILAAGQFYLQIETTGQVALYKYTYGSIPFRVQETPISFGSMCDGYQHQVGFSYQSGVGFTLLLDGGTATIADSAAVITRSRPLSVGGWDGVGVALFGSTLTGTVSNVAVFDGASTTSFATGWWNVAQNTKPGFVSPESTTARLTRVASYVGFTATTASGSGQLMNVQLTSGRSALDVMQEIAAAEGGVLFQAGDGTITLQGRDYRAGKTTAISLAADDVSADTAVTWDTQQTINQVTVTRTGGASQTVKDATSITNSGLYPTTLDISVDDDTDALSAAQWIVASHASPGQRIGSITINGYNSPNGATILGLGVGDHITLASMPSQLWSGAGDLSLEGWTETITESSWNIAGNVLPWSLFTMLILDDATYGALDSYPLGY